VEPAYVLIPSPLLGPESWALTAQVLERDGRRVRVPSLQGVSSSAPPFWPAGVDEVVRAVGGERVILVPHSNSGLYVPAVVETLGDLVQGVVFVDAALPGAGYVSTREFLDALVGPDGSLPPWTSWWDHADVDALFPDAEVRARVEAEQRRMPRAYWDHPPPAATGWERRTPCAYIWFGVPYDIAAEQASARGWPTRHVPGNHLHMLVDPNAVASAVLDLAAQRVWGRIRRT
jgi:pimeloyl-ACP methyl ester carboxylesterase